MIAGLLCGINQIVYAQTDDSVRDEWKIKKEAQRVEMYERLGVTDDQKNQLAEHRKRHKDFVERYRNEARMKRQELNEAIKSGEVEKARKINQEIKIIKGTMQDQRLESILGVRKILTEEQFSRFMDFKEQDRNWKGGKGFKKIEE